MRELAKLSNDHIKLPGFCGGIAVAFPAFVNSLDAHLSFLPLSVSGPVRTSRRAGERGEPACSEITTHKRTSDPRYVARVVEAGYPNGRRIRSTLLIERSTGRTVDFLHLVSNDHGQTWKLLQAGGAEE